MADELSPYSPEVIDRTLRQWDRWCSLAEGIGSSIPDAHRASKGKRYDPLTHADKVADVEKAMVFALVHWSLEWNVCDHVRRGFSLATIAGALRIRDQSVSEAYHLALERMALYLGWVRPVEESEDDVTLDELEVQHGAIVDGFCVPADELHVGYRAVLFADGQVWENYRGSRGWRVGWGHRPCHSFDRLYRSGRLGIRPYDPREEQTC